MADTIRAGHSSEIIKMIEDGDLIMGSDRIDNPYAPSSVHVVSGSLR